MSFGRFVFSAGDDPRKNGRMSESWFSASLRSATNIGDEVPTHDLAVRP